MFFSFQTYLQTIINKNAGKRQSYYSYNANIIRSSLSASSVSISCKYLPTSLWICHEGKPSLFFTQNLSLVISKQNLFLSLNFLFFVENIPDCMFNKLSIFENSGSGKREFFIVVSNSYLSCFSFFSIYFWNFAYQQFF